MEFFTRVRQEGLKSKSGNIKTSCFTSEKNSIFNVKNIYLVSSNRRTRRDVTKACYFQPVKITLLILSQSKITTCERYHLYSMDKTRYFTVENVIDVLALGIVLLLLFIYIVESGPICQSVIL